MRGLEGWQRTPCGHPSRLALKKGEHLRMTGCCLARLAYSSFHVDVRRGLLPADWAGDVGEAKTDFGERRG